ncbi:hypothetical protein UFOVP147_22 [uncultured Caudovirales phage]|uniref:Uncharacterized protein n=1 Tax=uncultured Caudovirales phage TaxID=2100421 RepID=A0A6J7W8W8_9CAUD|nr:hypothetical protein UFOVP147_22 [uncultured Caudovirales phage]
MRTIEKNLIAAVKAGKRYNVANTTFDPVCGVVSLHGNPIAKINGGAMLCSLAGWNTPTTRSRINALANTFGHPGVSTKKGQAFSGGHPVDVRAWF